MNKEKEYENRKDRGLKVQANCRSILCSCGCGEHLKELDKWGRKRKFISGHNGRKYNDPKEYKRVWSRKSKLDKDYKKKVSKNNTLRCQKHKAELIVKKGGKCVKCGLLYDGVNACCFDFHHITPNIKSFNVNVGAFNRFSKERIFVEADKCVLMCANCHRLEHQMNEY